MRVLVALAVMLAAVSARAEPVSVVVSVIPQKTFVEAIGGDRVKVMAMVAPGASPATYEPKARQMAELAGADVYFSIGVPFERAWLARFRGAAPEMKVVDSAESFRRMAMAAHDHGHDDHGHEDHGHEGHEHEGHGHEDHGHDDHAGEILDPHVWLSPTLVRLQAQVIRDTLIDLDPDHAADYHAGYRAFAAQVNEVDQAVLAALEGVARRRFMVFHPSWGYFARDYGLTQVPIEAEGKEPGPRALADLIARAKAEGIGAVFIQPQFSRSSAEAIAEAIGGRVVVADPLAADWAANLKQVAQTFATVLKE